MSLLSKPTLSERIQSLPDRSDQMSTSQLLRELQRNWQEVAKENEAQQGLVSPEDFQAWKNFDQRFGPKVRAAIQEGDRGAGLSIVSIMSQHTHESAGELSPETPEARGGILRRVLRRIGIGR